MKSLDAMLDRAIARNTINVHWNPDGFWELTDLSGAKHHCPGRIDVQDRAQSLAAEAGRQLFIDWHDNTRVRVVNP